MKRIFAATIALIATTTVLAAAPMEPTPPYPQSVKDALCLGIADTTKAAAISRDHQAPKEAFFDRLDHYEKQYPETRVIVPTIRAEVDGIYESKQTPDEVYEAQYKKCLANELKPQVISSWAPRQ